MMKSTVRSATAVLTVFLFVLLFGANVRAQTSQFTYQGRLTDSAAAANANYDFEFVLYDQPTGGNLIGTNTINAVAVSGGSFTVTLDFTAAAFPGAARYLETHVRRSSAVSGTSYTILTPRQPLTSAPYTIRAASAAAADTAANANQLGGISAANYLLKNGDGSQLTNVTAATANNVSGVVAIANGGTGSVTQNFVDLTTAQTNIAGAKTFTSPITAAQYNIGGNRILSVGGTNNLFAGIGAGAVNTGTDNSFVGSGAGQANTRGFFNSFIGSSAGLANTTGDRNSFFGNSAGLANTSGNMNSFFGNSAGASNTTGANNAFVGNNAGLYSTTGDKNSFFGTSAGVNNTIGANNAFVGYNAGLNNTTATDNLFVGAYAGQTNTAGGSNSFVGSNAGFKNTTASNNSFFGFSAGLYNTTGANNSFFGYNAGQTNTTGSNLTIIGNGADVVSNNLTYAAAVGAGAKVNSNNSVVLGRPADTVLVPGNLIVSGAIIGSTKNFKIDHPLDPLNKTLTYTSIESPDMMNIYNGNIMTDGRGEAVVQMPSLF